MIEVIAEAATVEGSSDKPGLLPGYGALPAAQVRELAQRAKLRPRWCPTTPRPSRSTGPRRRWHGLSGAGT